MHEESKDEDDTSRQRNRYSEVSLEIKLWKTYPVPGDKEKRFKQSWRTQMSSSYVASSSRNTLSVSRSEDNMKKVLTPKNPENKIIVKIFLKVSAKSS